MGLQNETPQDRRQTHGIRHTIRNLKPDHDISRYRGIRDGLGVSSRRLSLDAAGISESAARNRVRACARDARQRTAAGVAPIVPKEELAASEF